MGIRYKLSSETTAWVGKSIPAVFLTVLMLAGCSSSSSSSSDDETSASDEQTATTEALVDIAFLEVVDPAPQFNDPGEFGCDGCPDTDLSTDTVTTAEAVQSYVGLVADATSEGQWYVEAINGAAVAGLIETSDTGNFSLTVPLFCGEQVVKLTWSNEVGAYVLVNRVIREQCTDTDIQLTLSWDDLGQDFELHLVRPDGRINDAESDCTWRNCISTQPDWGVLGDASDNPSKDVDDAGTIGPENIHLTRPEAGTYSVFVEHWGNGDPEADGRVVLNVSGNDSILAEVEDLPPLHVWYVGDIIWPSREVVLDGRVIDCGEMWSSGCLLDLPQVVPEELVRP